MIVEKVKSPVCKDCGSYCIILTENGFECDDCTRITAQTSDLLKHRKKKFETTFKRMERINEII